MVGHAPLLLGLMLANVNNNNNSGNYPPITGTVVTHKQIIEVNCPRCKFGILFLVMSRRNVAVIFRSDSINFCCSFSAGSSDIHWKMSEMVGHAPILLALLVNNNNNNPLNIPPGAPSPIPGTVVTHKQIIEVNYLRCMFQITLIPIHSFPLLETILGNITTPRARTLTPRSSAGQLEQQP